MRVYGRSSASSQTTMPKPPLRCTAIGASSTQAGSPLSGSNTAAGWTPCYFSAASAESVGDVGERRIVVAVIRGVAAFAVDPHGTEGPVVRVLLKRRRDTIFGQLEAEVLPHRGRLAPAV